MTTVHIAIGNSDDKLTQVEWSEYYTEVDNYIRTWAGTVYGAWASLPTAPHQNACWAFEPADDWTPNDVALFQQRLSYIAGKWEQDSIAYNESETTMVAGRTRQDPFREPTRSLGEQMGHVGGHYG